jgi:hypothetical protein
VSGATESKLCDAAKVDDRTAAERGVDDRAQPANIEWTNAAKLRAITEEHIQILAATGC